MKAAVCEDEKFYADKLKKIAEDFFAERGKGLTVTVFSDGAPLLADMDMGNVYGVIFLDIQLESSDGMDIAAEIRKRDRSVPLIFVTGLENRAADGYAVSAFDYVVKSSMDTKLPAVLERLENSLASEAVTLEAADGSTVVISLGNVLWIESDGRGTVVVTEDGRIPVRLPIGAVSEKLPEELFTEIFKAVFVKTDRIKRVGKDTVEMSDGTALPLSRRRRKAVLSAVMCSVRRH